MWKGSEKLWRAIGMVTAGLVLMASGVAASPGEVQPLNTTQKIIGGLETHGFPSVVWLQIGSGLCTGTLIGCETVLTAAQCYCGETSFAECPALNPADTLVFAQHGGNYGVSSIAIHPGFDFGVTSDLAVLKLATPVTGISPSSINTTASPAFGSAGTIVGFGQTEVEIFAGFPDSGLKRFGGVVSSMCEPSAPDAPNICWRYELPVGPPGVNSTTCQGDSGGPLFTDFGLAGVTSTGSFGPGSQCVAPSLAVDSDVYFDRSWIQSVGGSDINNTTCGSIPQAFDANTQILADSGFLDAFFTEYRADFEVPADTSLARITLNAEVGFGNDFDLYVKAGDPPTLTDFDCGSFLEDLSPEFCEISSPAPGTWHILAIPRSDGGGRGGRFQTTVTLFGEVVEDDCNETTLCLDDTPGDRRFQVTLHYLRPGVTEGDATAIQLDSLGVGRGGIFWFFDQTNPEVLVKILDFCPITNSYAVFYAPATDVGFEMTIKDTQTGLTKTYFNPDGTTAPSVLDAFALDLCE